MLIAERYHDISCGHRVHGHENKCAHLHGHNYRIHFRVSAKQLDDVGRVVDFGVIKSRLCMWLEDNWDHRFLVSSMDPLRDELQMLDPNGVVIVPFNPTAENMANHLLTVVGPERLHNLPVVLQEVRIEETAKCSATATLFA